VPPASIPKPTPLLGLLPRSRPVKRRFCLASPALWNAKAPGGFLTTVVRWTKPGRRTGRCTMSHYYDSKDLPRFAEMAPSPEL
jgi:hypothetical protein